MNVKDLFKFLSLFHVTVVVSLGDLSGDVSSFLGINLSLSRDFFAVPEANLGYIKGLINFKISWEVYYNYTAVYSKD